jgi:hypothetical protein
MGMSTGTFSGKLSASTDVRTYRQHFAEVWRDFIVAEFESPAHVAFTFKVDPSTAEKWWAGSHAPQGWVVGRAMSDPAIRDAAIRALVEAA